MATEIQRSGRSLEESVIRREVGKVWEDGMNRAKVMEHYGYKDTQEAHVAMGFWKKESVPERIGLLSEL